MQSSGLEKLFFIHINLSLTSVRYKLLLTINTLDIIFGFGRMESWKIGLKLLTQLTQIPFNAFANGSATG